MTTVTKESLTTRIAELEAGPRSLKEDYYLAVMVELLSHVTREEHVVESNVRTAPEKGPGGVICTKVYVY